MLTCERCGRATSGLVFSYFDGKEICPTCDYREARHPLFQQARQEFIAAEKRGEKEFAGIGLPDDLKEATE